MEQKNSPAVTGLLLNLVDKISMTILPYLPHLIDGGNRHDRCKEKK
jgi:hypothetical protein